MKYKIVCRVTMLQKAGQGVLSSLQLNATPEGELSFEYKESGNQLIAFLDGEPIGVANEIYKEETPVKADAIVDAMKSDWNAKIIGLSDTPKCFEVEFIETEVKKEKIKKDVDFSKQIDEIVKNSIAEKEEIEERIACMLENRFPVNLIEKILGNYKKFNKPVKKPKTLYQDPNPTAPQSMLALCAIQALTGRATIYEGDKSVGKNVAAETLAWVMGLPYYLVTFNRMMTQDEIYGTKSTAEPELIKLSDEEALALAKEDKQKFEVLCAKAATVQIKQEISQLTEWLSDGGLMTFNEMNMADSNFFGSFTNQITDGTGFLDIPGVGRVYINPSCVLVGNQNKGYTGEMEQNEATMSRFGCLQFDYPKTIKGILKAAAKKAAAAGLDDQYYTQCDKLYSKLLVAVKKGQSVTNAVLNIRGFVAALDAVSVLPGYITLSKEIEINVINTCPEDDRAVLITTLQDTITL